MADFAPQNILKFEPNSILFDEQDRQPSDKIFRFLRESAEAPWKLQLMDYVPNSSLKSDRIHNPFSLNQSS